MPSAKIEPKTRAAARNAYAQIPSKDEGPAGSFSKTPYAYGDILITGGKLGGALQRDLIYWIERNTWGDRKRPEWAKLSLTAFTKLCQSWDDDKEQLRPVERKSVAIALADLERRGIIESRDRKGCGRTTTKMYKLTPERWKKAPPYKPPTPKELEQAELEANEESDAEPVIPDPANECAMQTVPSGKLSRPTPVSVRPARNAEPVTIRLVYNPSGFEFPVTFRARTGANGRIQVSAEPATNCSHGQPQLRKSSVDNKGFEVLESVAQRIAMEVWGYALENDLIRGIWARLGTAAAVETFENVCRTKLLRPGRHHHTPGLMLNLADQAARSYAAQSRIQARQSDGKHRAADYRALSPEELAELERGNQ